MASAPDLAEGPSFLVLSFDKQGAAKTRTRTYQTRRTHAKSKSGCVACKCDEAKPACLRCRRGNSVCFYSARTGCDTYCPIYPCDHFSANLQSQPELPGYLHSASDASWYGTPRRVLLEHFPVAFKRIQAVRQDMLGAIISLAMNHPYLLDAILAYSAAHLRHFDGPRRCHRVAEHFQLFLAIRNFQTALNQPLDQQRSDALLLTCALLNMLTLSVVEDDDPHNAWVFNTGKDALGFLIILTGFKPMLEASRPFQRQSLLPQLHAAGENAHLVFATDGDPLDKVPHSWRVILGLQEPRGRSSIFLKPARGLVVLRDMAPHRGASFHYTFSFLETLGSEFRELAQRRDERATWVMGYWLALLSRFNIWWLIQRVKRDSRAVAIWLDMAGVRARPDMEGLMWSEMMEDLENARLWPKPPGCR
ncbi:hypothetical protein S40288_00744 [Stachybotrys chartarum IBT 40288]|nr:hypothetical protein S40288_00744 [Stachybotrys chartarum IBT 40288]